MRYQNINSAINRGPGNGIASLFKANKNIIRIPVFVIGFNFVPDSLSLPGMAHSLLPEDIPKFLIDGHNETLIEIESHEYIKKGR